MTLLEARNLPVWGFPWQSNPYCRIEVGSQSFRSRKDDATSHAGSHRAPVWNQEFQFLVEDPNEQVWHLPLPLCHSHTLYFCRSCVMSRSPLEMIWIWTRYIARKCACLPS